MKLFARPKGQMTPIWSRGSRIMTKEYGELVDMESGCWAAVLGHNHPRILKAIHEQVETLCHTHQFFETEHAEKLVDELSTAAGLSTYSGTFLSSGSEAVSLAVKLSEVLTGKSRKLCMNITYLGACTDLRHPRNPECWDDLDVTGCLRCEADFEHGRMMESPCKACGKFEHLDFSQYAAFVFEAGNSGGLVLLPPESLIAYLTHEVRRAGGLLVANEVTTGFGRTGKWFGFQHYGFLNAVDHEPDFIALGKGLGNGYPISAVLAKPELAKAAEASGYRYVQSHIDDPLGCRIAREVVMTMAEGQWVAKGHETGEYLRGQLEALSERTDGMAAVRGRGMMNVVMLDREALNSDVEAVFEGLLKAGYFVGFSEALDFIHLYAPLILTKEEVDGFCEAFEGVLRGLTLEKERG